MYVRVCPKMIFGAFFFFFLLKKINIPTFEHWNYCSALPMVELPRCSERYTNYLSIIYMYTQRNIRTLRLLHISMWNYSEIYLASVLKSRSLLEKLICIIRLIREKKICKGKKLKSDIEKSPRARIASQLGKYFQSGRMENQENFFYTNKKILNRIDDEKEKTPKYPPRKKLPNKIKIRQKVVDSRPKAYSICQKNVCNE